jgi:uncharacterized lipoprotein YmbA
MGCSGTSKPSTFYLLKPIPEPESSSLHQGGPVLEIGPITIPAYLDRTQIATTADGQKLYMDQFNRWAEPLKNSLERVLAENMAILLNTANVYIHPQRHEIATDYQIEIAISRFAADADGTAVLVAYWSVMDNDGRAIMPRKRSLIIEPAASGDMDAIVLAQNKTLQQLSRDITDAIQSLR